MKDNPKIDGSVSLRQPTGARPLAHKANNLT